jgi:hypothetical protein
MQVADFQQDTGKTAPYLLTVAGMTEQLSVLRAVVFTGHRLLNALQLGTTSFAPQDAVAGACTAIASSTFAAVLQSQAPSRLSVQEVFELLSACKYYLADTVQEMIGESGYLQPMLEALPIAEVRLLCLLLSCCPGVQAQLGLTVHDVGPAWNSTCIVSLCMVHKTWRLAVHLLPGAIAMSRLDSLVHASRQLALSSAPSLTCSQALMCCAGC